MTTKVPVELSSTPSIVDGGNATAITIDSSENVGIGETSPLGKIHAKVSDTGASASAQGNLLVLEDTENGISILSSTSAAGYINFGDSDDNDIGMIIYDHSANAMRFWTNAAERMRIDTSGHVGIGAAPNTTGYGGTFKYLGVNGGSGYGVFNGQTTSTSVNAGAASFFGSTTGTSGFNLLGGMQVINIASSASNAEGGLLFYTSSGGSIPERMRIDNSGRLMVNQTAASAASAGVKMQVNSDILTRGQYSGYFWENRSGITIGSTAGWGGWYSTGTSVHSLYSDGSNIVSINRSSGAYTALSDKNKKKDFEDSTVGLAEVMQLQPKKFRMIDDVDDAPKKLGFVAQDVENVIPEAYVEDTNEDASGVESTFIGLTDRPIIAALTKAIQEQQTQIDALQSEINNLKGE